MKSRQARQPIYVQKNVVRKFKSNSLGKIKNKILKQKVNLKVEPSIKQETNQDKESDEKLKNMGNFIVYSNIQKQSKQTLDSENQQNQEDTEYNRSFGRNTSITTVLQRKNQSQQQNKRLNSRSQINSRHSQKNNKASFQIQKKRPQTNSLKRDNNDQQSRSIQFNTSMSNINYDSFKEEKLVGDLRDYFSHNNKNSSKNTKKSVHNDVNQQQQFLEQEYVKIKPVQIQFTLNDDEEEDQYNKTLSNKKIRSTSMNLNSSQNITGRYSKVKIFNPYHKQIVDFSRKQQMQNVYTGQKSISQLKNLLISNQNQQLENVIGQLKTKNHQIVEKINNNHKIIQSQNQVEWSDMDEILKNQQKQHQESMFNLVNKKNIAQNPVISMQEINYLQRKNEEFKYQKLDYLKKVKLQNNFIKKTSVGEKRFEQLKVQEKISANSLRNLRSISQQTQKQKLNSVNSKLNEDLFNYNILGIRQSHQQPLASNSNINTTSYYDINKLKKQTSHTVLNQILQKKGNQ